MLKAFRNFMARRTISANLRNRGMNTFSSYEIHTNIRNNAETTRKKENRPHEVLYFHKVDDHILILRFIILIRSNLLSI